MSRLLQGEQAKQKYFENNFHLNLYHENPLERDQINNLHKKNEIEKKSTRAAVGKNGKKEITRWVLKGFFHET